MPEPPSNVYRDQLSALSHGVALWDPNPPKLLYDKVSIGDVGYLIQEGTFIRMFNVMLPWDDPSNQTLGKPEPYDPLDCGPFGNILMRQFDRVDHSRSVTEETNVDNAQARGPDDAKGVTYKSRNRGALLSLPNGGHRENVIRTKTFENYIRDNIVNWFTWAQKNDLGVERMEDIILVSGCTLVASWAAAAFVDNTTEAEISLMSIPLRAGGANFVWNKTKGTVEYHNSPQNPPTTLDQCVFIKGFRAKRSFFWIKRMRAGAEPLPDDPENRRDDDIQVTRVPGASKYRDPLIGVLDYIAEKCPEDTIAIAHDDDLQLIENVETLTADAIEKVLREEKMPLLVENGVAILHDPGDNEAPVLDNKKITFYATAQLNGEPVLRDIHPVLTKYHLKLEITESPDHDYNLPKEELTSPAVYPPTSSLKLENSQGYPQIVIESFGDPGGAGVTVQDVLIKLHEDLSMLISKFELNNLSREELATMRIAFKKRCKTEGERSKGMRRIDRLGGRDRLVILPKLDEPSVAGPSSHPGMAAVM